MIDDNTGIIAREGVPFVIGAVTLLLFASFYGSIILTILFIAATAFCVWFFRNPERTSPTNPRAIICPADGVVVDDGAELIIDERYLNKEVRKLSIFMSPLNVHVNRAPFSGRVIDKFVNPGKFMTADKDKASFENEQTAIVVETEAGWSYGCIQIAGMAARRIVCYPEVGDLLDRGGRFGLIRFGSRVDLLLPPDFKINVKKGQKVKAGETIVGEVV